MAMATRQTKGGVTIQVKVVRDVQDKVLWADGWNMPAGREVVEYTSLVLSKNGKVLAQGGTTTLLHPKLDADLIAKGAVARLGDVYLSAEALALLNEALAEADAAETGSEEFWALKNAAAEAKARTERRQQIEEPMIREMEEFERRMSDPNSDL